MANLAARIWVWRPSIELARDILGRPLPNDLCLERALFRCVSDAAGALGPFLWWRRVLGRKDPADRRPDPSGRRQVRLPLAAVRQAWPTPRLPDPLIHKTPSTAR